MEESGDQHDYLRRLPDHYYQQAAWVHWTMTMDRRRKGWLDSIMHLTVREALLHTLARYRLVNPVYCLMPDHAHFIWCGCSHQSDQRRAVSFFRRVWNDALRPRGFQLQKQPHDRVMRKRERDIFEFQDSCVYVMKNPVRASLVEDWREWEFCGALIAGYPRLDLREKDFWKKFWTAYNREREPDLM